MYCTFLNQPKDFKSEESLPSKFQFSLHKSVSSVVLPSLTDGRNTRTYLSRTMLQRSFLQTPRVLSVSYKIGRLQQPRDSFPHWVHHCKHQLWGLFDQILTKNTFATEATKVISYSFDTAWRRTQIRSQNGKYSGWRNATCFCCLYSVSKLMNTSAERRYITKKRSEPHLSLFESVLAVSDYIKEAQRNRI